MALLPPKHSEMGAFYLVFRRMELSAEFGYTTDTRVDELFQQWLSFDT